jgi:hypothetical protein
VHNIGVVFTNEDEPSAAHIGSELVYLIKILVDQFTAILLLPKIRKREIVRLSMAELRKLKIYATDPEYFSFQSLDQMRTDKAAGSTNKSSFHFVAPPLRSTYNPECPLPEDRPVVHRAVALGGNMDLPSILAIRRHISQK